MPFMVIVSEMNRETAITTRATSHNISGYTLAYINNSVFFSIERHNEEGF